MHASRVRQSVAISVLGLVILSASGSGQASETYQLCGPGSTGFVRTGRQTICLGGSVNWKQTRSVPSSPAKAPATTTAPLEQPTVKAGSNKAIDNYLNSADMRFRDNDRKNGCEYVAMAIREATGDGSSGAASAHQRSQIKTYAGQCNLRF